MGHIRVNNTIVRRRRVSERGGCRGGGGRGGGRGEEGDGRRFSVRRKSTRWRERAVRACGRQISTLSVRGKFLGLWGQFPHIHLKRISVFTYCGNLDLLPDSWSQLWLGAIISLWNLMRRRQGWNEGRNFKKSGFTDKRLIVHCTVFKINAIASS